VVYDDGVGVVDRWKGGRGGLCEIGLLGLRESLPEVVSGVRSRTSGKTTRHVFFEA
jgi:hypothetical protein